MTPDATSNSSTSQQDQVHPEVEQLAKVLRETFGVSMQLNGESMVEFSAPESPETMWASKSVAELIAVLEDLRKLRPAESLGFALISDNTAEVAVADDSRVRPVRVRDISFTNEAEGLVYEIGRPSIAFTFAFARLLSEVPPRERMPLRMSHFRIVSSDQELVDPFAALPELSRLSTIRITSEKARSEREWQSLAESLYFHLGYNLDLALVPRASFTDLLRTSRVSRMRRGRTAELDPPRRLYDSNLVRSYQVGLASESVMLAYLSFYHVAEHWFEDVFLDDVARRVQSAITAPDFSARRKKDLRRVITEVSKSLRTRDDSMVISEVTALELTLRKYVQLDDLRDALNQYDSALLEHYASSVVTFSGGDLASLGDSPSDKQFKRLAHRIYKTRNALVHRKDGDKSRYTPYKDDKALRLELPLLRFIAEQIIIGSSSVL